RLEQRLAGREPAGCPAALRTGVVAREDRVHGAVLLRLVPEEELAGEDSSVAEQLVDRLRAEREERREQRLEAVHRAERDVEDGARTGAIALDERPWRLVAHVLVDQRREPHRLGERGLEARLLDLRAYRLEP